VRVACTTLRAQRWGHAGNTTITASAFSSALLTTITGQTTLTVLPVLTGLSIPPGTLAAPIGETFQLQAQGTFSDAFTQDLTSLVTWATSNPAVASLTSGGLVTTRSAGVAALTATAIAGRTVTSPSW
jgi:hypothetical protein